MIEFDNIIEYLSFRLDVLYQLKGKKTLKKLTSKPKLFYIYNILLYLEGIDISGIDASEQLRDLMEWKTTDDVYTYRTNLKKAGWLIDDTSTKGGYNILPVFQQINLNNLVINYNFKITCTNTSFRKI